MSEVEFSAAKVYCHRCGRAFGRRKGFFPASYAPLYKGLGFIPLCRDCINAIYQQYLQLSNGDDKMAIRQFCRKLDLYWDENVYNLVAAKSSAATLVSKYLSKLNTTTYLGKCYDDTLENEGTLWNWKLDKGLPINYISGEGQAQGTSNYSNAPDMSASADETPITIEPPDDFVVTDDMVKFWGSGYTRSTYGELEQRKQYWMSRFPDDYEIGVGTEALIKQICSMEMDINRDRAAGKSVEKTVKVFNELLGSANLKPKKNDNTDDSLERIPMGVWIWRFENERPIPGVDPELEDVDGILKYVLTWFFGHIAKMLSVKNLRSKLYEKAIEKYRVAHPEYDDEDDDDMMYELFGGDESYDEE